MGLLKMHTASIFIVFVCLLLTFSKEHFLHQVLVFFCPSKIKQARDERNKKVEAEKKIDYREIAESNNFFYHLLVAMWLATVTTTILSHFAT